MKTFPGAETRSNKTDTPSGPGVPVKRRRGKWFGNMNGVSTHFMRVERDGNGGCRERRNGGRGGEGKSISVFLLNRHRIYSPSLIERKKENISLA